MLKLLRTKAREFYLWLSKEVELNIQIQYSYEYILYIVILLSFIIYAGVSL